MGSNIPSEKKLRLAKMLQYLYISDKTQHSQQEISDEINWSTSEVGRLTEIAEENKLLTVNRKPNTHIYNVTKPGKKFFEEVDPYSETWERSKEELEIQVELHYLTARIPLSYPENLPDGWKETMVKASQAVGSEYWESNDSVRLKTDGFSVRFTSDNAFIRIDDPIISSNLAESKFEMMDKILKAKNWIEEETPTNFNDRFLLKIDISTQHIAIEDDPLHYFVDAHSEVDVTDVEIKDDDGKLLLWCDCSDGKRHLEMGGGNSPGGDIKIAEDGIETILDVYRSIVEHRRNWRDIVGLIEDGVIGDLHNHIRQLARRIHSLENRVEELEENNTKRRQNDSLVSPKSRPNHGFNYWLICLAIKPLNLILMQLEVITIEDYSFDQMLRQTVREEVKKQLGMIDTSKRRTENELKDLIQEELEKRPKTATELRNALDANRSTILNQLQKLEKVGAVEETEIDGNSYWRLK